MASQSTRYARDRFHGRVHGNERTCDHPGCREAGEFRAPASGGHRRGGFDGPGDYRWLCLDHVREFNARYNFFAGMNEDEIYRHQRPTSGWERETRAFASAGDPPPRWQDFADPLDAIGARFRTRVRQPRPDGRPLSDRDRENLQVLGLDADADRKALRRRYAELVREYHPDRNGGDRSKEKLMLRVIDAYQELKRAPAFA